MHASPCLRATLVAVLLAGAALQAGPHPLDPLSFQEYWTVLKTLDAEGRLDRKTRFSLITLNPPPKALVWAWDGTGKAPRAATAVVRQEKESFEAEIDLTAGKLVFWRKLDGEQPNWLDEEFEKVQDKLFESEEFLAALKRRGLENTAFLSCSGGPPGYYGTEEQKGRRVAQVFCHDMRDVRNKWTRQVEGLTAVFDMNEEKILRIVEESSTPVPETTADYDAASLGEPREVPGPIFVQQPLGPGYKLDGHIIEWQNWRLHARPDQRAGPVISTVTYDDHGRRRPILYEGHLSEMFVPYMDPAFRWYQRNFLDAGEYPAGGMLKPLMPGLDCPSYAYYMGGLIHDDKGRPQVQANLICVFERETGDMSWRHISNDPESRVKRDLVIRGAAVVGNYDYVFDWIFQQDGSIQVAVGATGIVEAKMVKEKGSSGEMAHGETAPDAYGRFVDKHIIGVNHDHYFSFRLDLDVDGSKNEFAVDKMVQKLLPDDHPRRSIWVHEESLPERENDAKLTIDLTKPRMWRVKSTTAHNHVGYPTSYELMPGRNTTTLLSEDDYPRMRARFIDHHLWVTPYAANERWAAGVYPTLSTPGMGLPEWTRGNRSIRDTDVVLYHTIGMHHMVRAEDWPVMPVMWHSFELRPFDFFDRNPAMDLPR